MAGGYRPSGTVPGKRRHGSGRKLWFPVCNVFFGDRVLDLTMRRD